jgi:histone H3/H4
MTSKRNSKASLPSVPMRTFFATPSVLPRSTLLYGSVLAKRKPFIQPKRPLVTLLQRSHKTAHPSHGHAAVERQRPSREKKAATLPDALVKRIWTNMLKTSALGSFGINSDSLDSVFKASADYFQHVASELGKSSKRDGRNSIRLEDAVALLESHGVVNPESTDLRGVILKYLPKEFADKLLKRVLQ